MKAMAAVIDTNADPETINAYKYLLGRNGKFNKKAISSAQGYANGARGQDGLPELANKLQPLTDAIKKAKITNNMNKGYELFIINDQEDKPVFRALVQRPGKLDYPDLGIGTVAYTEETIKDSIHSLLGKHLIDRTQSIHSQQEDGVITEVDFGKIINTSYCPGYGGYVDFEITDDNYISKMYDVLDSLERGLPVDRAFSTEFNLTDYEKVGKQDYIPNSIDYGDLIWTNNPRDPGSQLCSVVMNSIKEEEDIIMVEYTKEDYEALEEKFKEKEQELMELQSKYDNLKPEDFTEFQELKNEEQALREMLVPIWTLEGEQKLEMVNSILETYPEAEREQAQKTYEGMESHDLKVIINRLKIDKKEDRGIQNGGEGSGRKPKEDKEAKEAEKIMEQLEDMGYF